MRNSVLFVGLRHLRTPIIAMVVVFAVGVAGLVLIPGTAADGSAWHMNFMQALYFMSYTATTIGFGEIPQAFTDMQRFWVTIMIFASVIGWAYLIGSLLRMAQDESFRGVLTAAAFARDIRSIREPFYLICGFGETGYQVARSLDRMRRRFVVIDIDPERVQELDLLDLVQDPPGLCADARLPEVLRSAGLDKPQCLGVLALTNDDQVNLAVAMTARLLNPQAAVLARAMSPEVAANMASFGTQHIIDPFARFGAYLALALAAPANHRLASWLTAPPDSDFEEPAPLPRGHWVVCGYGRFGRAVVAALRDQGLDVTIIDPDEGPVEGLRTILGTGTEAGPLRAAGIGQSVGIVAGTDDDVTNLSIVFTARELNPALFTIVRHNLQANNALFEAFDADITMVPSKIVANECIAVLKTPNFSRLLAMTDNRDEAWAGRALELLGTVVGTRVPEVWSVKLSEAESPAIHASLAAGRSIDLRALIRSPAERALDMPVLPLGLARAGQFRAFPDADERLAADDRILFAGTARARRDQVETLRNLRACEYVLTGVDQPASWVARQLLPRGTTPS